MMMLIYIVISWYVVRGCLVELSKFDGQRNQRTTSTNLVILVEEQVEFKLVKPSETTHKPCIRSPLYGRL